MGKPSRKLIEERKRIMRICLKEIERISMIGIDLGYEIKDPIEHMSSALQIMAHMRNINSGLENFEGTMH